MTIRAAIRAIVEGSEGQDEAIVRGLTDYACECMHEPAALLSAVARELGVPPPDPLGTALEEAWHDAAGAPERASAILRERLDARENPALAASLTSFLGGEITRLIAEVALEEAAHYHGVE